MPVLPQVPPTRRPRALRSLATAALGAALLVPLAPSLPASAAPPAPHVAPSKPVTSSKPAVKPDRATRATLAAYGDADGSGRVHLTGSVRWSNGKGLGHKQQVELWGRVGTRWSLVRRATTDRSGEVELSVRPKANTTYQLRFAGSRSGVLSSPAKASKSRSLTVHAVARVALTAPATAKRGERFGITGTVAPGGSRRVTVLGNGQTFTTLTTRPDGSFSGHVRLRMTTTLTVVLPGSPTLDETVSGPRRVRVS